MSTIEEMPSLSSLVNKLFNDSGEFVRNARLSESEWIWLQRVRDLNSLVCDLENTVKRPEECLVEVCIAIESLFPNFHKSDVDFVVAYGAEANRLVTAICEMVIGPHPSEGDKPSRRNQAN